MSISELSEYLRVERKFIKKINNKRQLIDFLWQTRKISDVDFTVRDVIANRFFSPYTGNIQKFFIPIYDRSRDEITFYKDLAYDMVRNSELKEIYYSNEKIAIELYDHFWNEYSSLNSVIPYIILTSKYPSCFNEIKKKLVKWYVDERQVAFDSMNGEYFNYAFIDAFPAIHTFLKDFGISLVCSILANEASNTLRNVKNTSQLMENFKNNEGVQNIVKSKVSRNLLFEYLFLLDISVKEIEDFKKTTIMHLQRFMNLNFPDNKLNVLQKMSSNNIYFDEKIYSTCTEVFLKIEFNKDLSAYVLDPYFKTIINRKSPIYEKNFQL